MNITYDKVKVNYNNYDLARRYNIKAGEGVVVVGVAADSKAEEAGLRVGDVIKEE